MNTISCYRTREQLASSNTSQATWQHLNLHRWQAWRHSIWNPHLSPPPPISPLSGAACHHPMQARPHGSTWTFTQPVAAIRGQAPSCKSAACQQATQPRPWGPRPQEPC